MWIYSWIIIAGLGKRDRGWNRNMWNIVHVWEAPTLEDFLDSYVLSQLLCRLSPLIAFESALTHPQPPLTSEKLTYLLRNCNVIIFSLKFPMYLEVVTLKLNI